MRRALFDAAGLPVGFWEAGRKDIPDGAVEIADVQWREFLAHQGYRKWTGAGVAVYEPPPTVPAAVYPLQARKALRQAGLKEQVDAHIATLTEPEQEAWEYAIQIERDHPTVASAAAALGLTDEQVDDLFRLAATL